MIKRNQPVIFCFLRLTLLHLMKWFANTSKMGGAFHFPTNLERVKDHLSSILPPLFPDPHCQAMPASLPSPFPRTLRREKKTQIINPLPTFHYHHPHPPRPPKRVDICWLGPLLFPLSLLSYLSVPFVPRRQLGGEEGRGEKGKKNFFRLSWREEREGRKAGSQDIDTFYFSFFFVSWPKISRQFFFVFRKSFGLPLKWIRREGGLPAALFSSHKVFSASPPPKKNFANFRTDLSRTVRPKSIFITTT